MRAACRHQSTAGGMGCALQTVLVPGRGAARQSALCIPRGTYADAFRHVDDLAI